MENRNHFFGFFRQKCPLVQYNTLVPRMKNSNFE